MSGGATSSRPSSPGLAVARAIEHVVGQPALDLQQSDELDIEGGEVVGVHDRVHVDIPGLADAIDAVRGLVFLGRIPVLKPLSALLVVPARLSALPGGPLRFSLHGPAHAPALSTSDARQKQQRSCSMQQARSSQHA